MGHYMNEALIAPPSYWITSRDGVKSYLENKVKKGRAYIAKKSAGGTASPACA